MEPWLRRCCMIAPNALILSETRSVQNRFRPRRSQFEHSVEYVDCESDFRDLRFGVSTSEPAAYELARAIASKSPIALQAAKESILAARRMPMDEGLKFERAWFGLLFSTHDMDEGVSAFLEKRKAEFTGV